MSEPITGIDAADGAQHAGTQMPAASFRQRLIAMLIDVVVLSFVDGRVQDSLAGPDAAGIGARAASLISFALPFIYFAGFYTHGGQTLGKRMLNIRVVTLEGRPLGWRQAFARVVGYVLSAMPLYLGYLWALWDRDGAALHDKLSGTRVVCADAVQLGQRNLSAPEAAGRTRLRRPTLLGGALLALFVCGGGAVLLLLLQIFQSHGADLDALGAWPDAQTSPDDMIHLDLSAWGLAAEPLTDARSDPAWASRGWQYRQGSVAHYRSGGQVVVSLWALKYDDAGAAGADSKDVVQWASQNCGSATWASGVIHCGYSDAYDKMFWNDCWIVDILASRGTGDSSEELVNSVRDALAAHWKGLLSPAPQARTASRGWHR